MNKLTKEEEYVIDKKGTEAPYIGKYNDFYEEGIFTCKRCDAKLYSSNDKFASGCGWPSFDDEISGAIEHIRDVDGTRVEITCKACGGHLGHVFKGEGFTSKNIRHCVNSISLNFTTFDIKKAYFAGGCFWGVEYFFNKQEGVLDALSGFMGGHTLNPTYQDICYKDTGHLEVVEVSYDPQKVSYEKLARLFFETHDPTQTDGQGPDIGSQYLSAVFVSNEEEKIVVEKLIAKLEKSNLRVATKILKKQKFYVAEDYHQYYYKKSGKTPYCHSYAKRFK